MKKSFLKTVFLLFATVIFSTVLFACTPTDKATTYSGLVVQQGTETVTAISITAGEKINYSQYRLLINVSDGTSFTDVMSESLFLQNELDSLYALMGGNTITMSLFYQRDGKSARGLLEVRVLAPVAPVVTYTVSYVLKGDYSKYTFEADSGVSTIMSVPETHPQMAPYQKITWYRAEDCNISSELDTPYELSGDITLFGKVRDDRSYTVRFYKESAYQNQIGEDIRVGYGAWITFPSGEAVTKPGSNLVGWAKGSLDLGHAGGGTNQITDECDAYPNEQIINIHARYELKIYNISFFYMDAEGDVRPMEIDGKSLIPAKHDSLLVIGSKLSSTDTLVTVPAPNFFEGYEGGWYIGEQAFGKDQTKTVSGDIILLAKYKARQCTVSFQRHTGGEITNFIVNYGKTIAEAAAEDPKKAIPALLADDGYNYAWDNADALTAPVKSNLIFTEVQTAKNFSYIFFDTDGSARLKEITNSPYNSDIALWTTAEIEHALGANYKTYFKYGWYPSVDANPAIDTPMSGNIKQSATTMKFYLKYTDLRQYTIKYFYAKAGDNTLYRANVPDVTVGYGKTADYPGEAITGWLAKSLCSKNDGGIGGIISNNLAFTPSAVITGEYTIPVVMSVVVMYERETYIINLYEPAFGSAPCASFPAVPYETIFGTLDFVSNYNTSDRTHNLEIYRFYGWVKGQDSTDIVPLTEKLTGATNLYAQWVPLSEGTLGTTYETYSDGGRTYARVIGYSGNAAELLIGSKYKGYEVREIGNIQTAGAKNLTVTKVRIPNTVQKIHLGAFSNFFSINEIEVATESTYFSTIGGVLYNFAKTELMVYPYKKAGNFTVPNSVTAICDSAFSNYQGTQITLSDGLSSIGKVAFSAAANLTGIALPATLTSLGQEAFRGCSVLSSVTFSGDKLTSIGQYVFQDTPFINNMTSGIVKLGAYLILGGADIAEDYILPNDIVGIADGAFSATKIATFTVQVGSQLLWIGNRAFYECQQLNAFYIAVISTEQLIEFGDNVFDGMPNTNFFVYVANDEAFAAYIEKYAGTDYDGDIKLGTRSAI